MRESEGRRRPPSIRDVADRAGVSYQTVSRVLNEHPSLRPGTVERVQTAIRDLGYRPNRAARALVTSRNHTIGVLLSARALYGPFSSFLTIVDAARERGYAVTTTPIAGDRPEDIVEGLDALLAHGVEGIVAIAPQDRAREAVRRSGAAVPVLTLQGGPDEVNDFGFDQQEGARLAVRHLLELGHRRIAVLSGPADRRCARARLDGARAAMAAAGTPLDEALVRVGPWFAFEDGVINGQELLRLPDRPTAVVCGNDLQALGVYEAARQAGLRIPDDLSVVGFDDITNSRWCGPAMTTVRQPLVAMGAAAAELALTLAAGQAPAQPRVELATTLMVRDSTAPPGGKEPR
jgi:LacI family xylobiose transport system transcriptional regulator